MAFRFQDLEASQAADINQALGQLTGYGFVEGGEPHEGGKPFAVDVRGATTYIDGEQVSTDAISINLENAREYIDFETIPGGEEKFGDYDVTAFEKPHKIIIYIGADGAFYLYPGDPATAKPRGRLRFETFQPSPPDFRRMPGVPVAEVWVGAFSQHITDEDIRDRRLNAQMDGRALDAQTIDVQELIDGSGARRTELVDIEDSFDTTEIREVINADSAHGTDAPHDYFSGSHDDLDQTTVATDDHHTRYTDTEAVSAVDGRVDLASLTAGTGTTPGYHLALGDTGPAWENPPMAEAPVLDAGTITHTGGSDTVATLSGITPTETAQFELVTAIGVESSPSWSGDYAYSIETAYRWHDDGNDIEATLRLSWDTDPGSGNDLPLRYAVYEMSPEKVGSMYDDGDAAGAMAGESLSLSETEVGLSLTPPVFDTPGDAPTASTGDVIMATDPDTGTFGEFVYDGLSWTGPYTDGTTALTDVTIDTAKDWGGYSIGGVGAPPTTASVIRQTDLADHAALDSPHHAKTVSSDIDHALVTNVQSGQHHTRYADAEAVDTVGARVMTPTISATTIPDGGEVRVHTAIADGETCTLFRGEVLTEDGHRPDGLTLQVAEVESGDVHYSQASRYAAADSPDAPLATIAGPTTLDIYLSNTTGQTVAAGGSVSYWLDQSGA